MFVAQDQILYRLIKHEKLKHATNILGVQDVKIKKSVIENILKAFAMFGKLRKHVVQVAHRVITTDIVAPRTSRQQKLATMSKLLHVSIKTLHKHTKFRV